MIDHFFNKHKWTIVCIYFIFFAFLALWFHKDVIFNIYNYGRHWDWTFFTFSDFYANYLKQFIYVINDNRLGSYGSIFLTDFLTKSFVFAVSKLVPFLSVSILNKVTVFVLFPLISTFGIYALSKRILSRVYKTNVSLFLIITIFVNFLYTFSLPILFDIHGGAINRTITSTVLPYLFLALYNYFISEDRKYMNRDLFLTAGLFMFFDFASIFYYTLIVSFLIILKRNTFGTRLVHLFIFGISQLLMNIYWLQGLFLSKSVNILQVINAKRTSFEALAFNSTKFKDLIFMLDSQQHVSISTFSHNAFIYIPYLFYYLILLRILFYLRKDRSDKRLFILLLTIYLLTTILVTGTNSLGSIYQSMYRFQMFTFIEIAQRFLPNLAIFMVFLLLFLYKFKYESSQKETSGGKVLFIIPIVIWTVFLLLNGNLLTQVYQTYLKTINPQGVFINNQIGALYQEDPSILSYTRNQKLIYNILPVPSSFYPIFLHNVYPPTSQGPDVETIFDKGVLTTYDSPSPIGEVTDTYLRSTPTQTLFPYLNIRYVWYKNSYQLENLQDLHSFSSDWIAKAQKNDSTPLKKIRNNTLYEVDPSLFTPVIYSPQETIISSSHIDYLPQLVSEFHPASSSVIIFRNQNPNLNLDDGIRKQPDPPVIEFNRINPTQYVVVIHGIRGTLPLIFSKQYYKGWQIYPVKYQPSDPATFNLKDYKILRGNEDDQASPDELRSDIGQNWISTLGDEQNKSFTHVKFMNNTEKFDYNEDFSIDFISKKIKNVIQNNNLTLNSFENYGPPISDDDHLIANGYANAWMIDPHTICQDGLCRTKPDGSYDMELVVDFAPQKQYAVGVAVSISTFVALMIFYVLIKKQRYV